MSPKLTIHQHLAAGRVNQSRTGKYSEGQAPERLTLRPCQGCSSANEVPGAGERRVDLTRSTLFSPLPGLNSFTLKEDLPCDTWSSRGKGLISPTCRHQPMLRERLQTVEPRRGSNMVGLVVALDRSRDGLVQAQERTTVF